MEFVELVECIRKHLRADRDPVGKGVTWKNILAELANPTMEITKFEVEFWTEYYGQGMPDFCSMSPEALKANYHSAKEYCRRRERRLGTDRSSCAPRVAVSAPVLGWNAYLARTAPDRKRRKPE